MPVRGDVVRVYGYYSFGLLMRMIALDRTFRVIFTMRLCKFAYETPFPLRPILLTLGRLFHGISQQLAGVDLPWRTQIGEGLRIIHGWGLVVNPNATIGRNVTLLHGVTIGQRDKITPEGRETGYPIIEDEVWIGPHAVVLGGIRVGRGSRIGAGAVVINRVAPHSIVVGNPGQVIATNALPDVLFPVKFEDT